MKIKKIVVVLISTLMLITLTGYILLKDTLNTATGFSAKNICSGYFISGFSAKMVLEEALIPVDNSFSYVDFKINEQQKYVTTKILGAFERKAVYEKGVGCTLLAVGQNELKRSVVPLERILQTADVPWPDGLGQPISNIATIDYQSLNNTIESFYEKNAENSVIRTKAIVVIYKGQLIAEAYANGINLETPLLSWSMAKSITNMQVGLLVKDKKLFLNSAPDIPLWKMLSVKHQQITLDQLMRMSSGLEFSEVYGMGSDAAVMLSVEPSASDFATNKPLTFEPDTHWSYSSGTSNIIAGIVKKAIGGDFQHYYEFAQRRLFHPLNIHTAQLETDANGTFVGSSYMYASARDWAKLGQLFLQNGRWKQQQLLPEEWVKYSTTPTKTDPLNHYGAQFWLNKNPADPSKTRVWPSIPTDAYYMSGFQGQNVVIVPSKDLVVVKMGFKNPSIKSGIESLVAGVIKALDKRN